MQDSSRESAVILIIDDEPTILDGLTRVLTTAGYACRSAINVTAATQMAKDLKPDLVISDINLDGSSGLMMCEQLKKDPTLAKTPFIFLSGAQIPDVIRRAHACGGTYYIRKPFDPQVLLELVDKALWMPHLVENRLATV
jgi:CheY-like chemotaxis protein